MLRSSKACLFVVASGIAVVATGVAAYRRFVSADTADVILAKADQLSWENQWIAATPLYAEAERLYAKENHPSKALYAHVSQYIPRAESEPLPSLLLELQRDQSLPAAMAPETRLRILVIEGMIETNYDASMALTTWQQVQDLAGNRGHYLLMARAMGERGIAAFLLGDFAAAKKLVLRGWLTAKYLHDPAAHVRYASVYGAGLVELQRYDEAIHALDEAIDTAAKSPGVAYPSIAVNSKIDALRGLHRHQEALALSDQAILRLPHGRLDAHLFQILTSKGEVYDDLGRNADAVAQYAVALHYARGLSYWRGITQTGGLLAHAYEKENNLAAALDTINEAIQANEQLPEELYFSPRNLAIKAEILDKMGRAKQAHALYEESLALIDSLLTTAPTPNVERALLTQLEQVYSGYFASLCQAGDINDAFGVVEKARGRIEAQALEHHAVVQPHEPTAQERQITQLNLELIETNDPGVRERLSQSLYDAELELDDSSLAGIAAKRPLALRQVQTHLRPGEFVLEYVLADPTSWVLAITRGGVHKYDLPARKVVEADALQYRKEIRDRKMNPKLAQALFDELLAPIAEYRTSSSMIVVPDGALHLLPFSALMDQGEYVLKNHAVSASPSSTVLCLLRNREGSTLRDPLQYVGVAAWSGTKDGDNVIFRSIAQRGSKQVQPLPESQEEVETIAHSFPESSTLLLGNNATETKFKSLPLADYRVLHLALHGYADLEYPDRSALVFAPEHGGPDDGLLEVREIRALRLKARLVTLSACNTGVGPVGEAGVANLVNAFIEAGAESVVSTLWELEDRPTERLITSFYRNLASGRDKVDALRGAQLEFVRAGLPPYYWASFEMVGDPTGTLEKIAGQGDAPRRGLPAWRNRH